MLVGGEIITYTRYGVLVKISPAGVVPSLNSFSDESRRATISISTRHRLVLILSKNRITKVSRFFFFFFFFSITALKIAARELYSNKTSLRCMNRKKDSPGNDSAAKARDLWCRYFRD